MTEPTRFNEAEAREHLGRTMQQIIAGGATPGRIVIKFRRKGTQARITKTVDNIDQAVHALRELVYGGWMIGPVAIETRLVGAQQTGEA